MNKLLILSSRAAEYRTMIEKAHLPNLTLEHSLTSNINILFGEPALIKGALASLPALGWAQSIWAGVEPLLGADNRRDYILTNARGVFGTSMTEYVFGHLLAHEIKIKRHAQAQLHKHWDNSYTGTLRGKTIALLGVGSIGAEVARAAKFFNMTVYGYTRESEACKYVDKYFHPSTTLESFSLLKENFAKDADYLVSVLPNTIETRKLINADLLSALPHHAIFINVGRGSAVDESALINALEQNKLAAAVLDVFEQEPLPTTHPFWTTKNLHMTYHTSAPSLPEDIINVFIENYLLFNEGKPLKHQVDFERGY